MQEMFWKHVIKWREAGEANTIISSFKAQLEAANKSPKAWWDYNIKGIQRETRHLFEDGRMYLIKYMDTQGYLMKWMIGF